MLGWTVIPRVLGVSPHGIGIAIGYFVGTFVMARRARTRNFDEDHVWNAALWGMFGAIVGARVAYIIGHFDQFASLLDMLKIWEGGISLVGGLMGGIGAGFLYCKRKGLSFLELMDLAAPGLGIGIALGRSGDLVIGDHLGKQTDGWWGWRYQGGELISPPPCVTPDGQPVYASANGCIEPGMVVHQTALYDMIWSLVILGILVLIVDRKPRPRGFMFFSWGVLYALGRVATDFMRVDKTWFGLGLTGSQLTSIAFILLAAIYMVRSRAPVAAVGGTQAREQEREGEEPP
jgi:phosphatidylglycerol:prolipoprotein diacylglycerol transferase